MTDRVTKNPPLFKRACDACRARKVRCDKSSPCSACKASDIPCHTSPPEARPKRTRVNVSEEYEKKIDLIHSRLAGLDHGIPSIRDAYGPLPLPPLRTPSTTAGSPRSPSEIHRPKDYASPFATHEAIEEDNNAFEGETSLFAHSMQARQLLERAVKSNPTAARDPEMATALSSLRKMVAIPETHYGTRKALQMIPGQTTRIDLMKLQLPPIDAVLEILRKAKVVRTLTCSYPIPFLTLDQLTDLCKSVFFSVEPYPTSTAVLVHGYLYWLFDEFSWIAETPAEKSNLLQNAELCRKNLEISLNNFDVLLPATYDNVIALMLGACYATEISKVNMCWKLNTTAANLAQSMGWHCGNTMTDDTADQRRTKQTVFWFIYIIDKALSLRLGRAPVLQDYDIDLDLPTMSDTAYGPLSTQVFHLWVRLAGIYGRIYQQLYSPRALKDDEAARKERAYKLLEECEAERAIYDAVQREYADTDLSNIALPLGTFRVEVGLKLLFLSDNVLQYVMLSIIHRAIPPPDGGGISAACLEASRKALVLHHEAAELGRQESEGIWSIYLHWTILYSPFTPFIIVFLHVLRSPNPSDLDLLSQFVGSLTGDHSSHGVKRMHKLCTIFYQIAKFYVQSSQGAHPAPSRATNSPSASYLGNILSASTSTSQYPPFPAGSASSPSASSTNTRFGAPLTPSNAMTISSLVSGPPQQHQPVSQPHQPPSQQWGPINPYLNALGFVGDPTLDGNVVMNSSLSDWFSGNQYIMGLLDEDLAGWAGGPGL